MKAVFGAPSRHIFAALNRAIFDGHTYANSSGGDPAVMPQLTYEGLFAFFERFYHPGNAIFVSRGNVPLTRDPREGRGDRRHAARPRATRRVDPGRAAAGRPRIGQRPDPRGGRGGVARTRRDRLGRRDAVRRLLRAAAARRRRRGRCSKGDASPVRRAIRESGLARGAIDTMRVAVPQPAARGLRRGRRPGRRGASRARRPRRDRRRGARRARSVRGRRRHRPARAAPPRSGERHRRVPRHRVPAAAVRRRSVHRARAGR